jgi:hypothetical protein
MAFYRSRPFSRPHRCTLLRHSRQAKHSCHHQHSRLYMALHRLLPAAFAASFQTVDGTSYTRYILHPPSIHPHSLFSAFLTSTFLLPQKPFRCLRQYSRHHRYTLIPPFQPSCAQLLSPENPTVHDKFSTFLYITPTACSKKASPLRVQLSILAHPLVWLAALPPSCLRHTSSLRSFSTVHANSAVPSSYSNISARLRTAALAHNPLSA